MYSINVYIVLLKQLVDELLQVHSILNIAAFYTIKRLWMLSTH